MSDDKKRTLIERLFIEQGGRLRAFIARRIRRKSDAEELAQEVYLRMLRVDLSTVDNLQGYLFTVAHNLCRENALRERPLQGSLDVEDPKVQDEFAQWPSFAAELDNEQRVRRLREVLAQLSPKCRAAVELKFWQGLSYEEIAQRLEISTNMVKKYLTQALVHCRRRMARLG